MQHISKAHRTVPSGRAVAPANEEPSGAAHDTTPLVATPEVPFGDTNPPVATPEADMVLVPARRLQTMEGEHFSILCQRILTSMSSENRPV
jgi:hypothetical protein